MADVVEAWLAKRGWTVRRQCVDAVEQRFNLFAYYEDKSHPDGHAGVGPVGNPAILLNTHIDTVPPYIPPSEDAEFLYGRGACDTKSLLAAMMLAAHEAVTVHGVVDVGLLLVVGEETDHIGMKRANELKLTPRHLVVGEPTESRMARRQKGIVKASISCEGVAAHSGYPETGVNALLPLMDILGDIRAHAWPSDPLLGDTTVNFIVREGGVACNVVPARAVAELLVRVVTTPEDIQAQLSSIVGTRGKIEFTTCNPPIDLSVVDECHRTRRAPTDPVNWVLPSAIVNFNTDIPYFELAAPGKAYLYGAGSILHAHTANERMSKADLRQCRDVYVDLIRHFATSL
ncbi:hypothetical protein CAOG_005616 [Capsaspora owczarzaki ATCC 30864]|uniref:Peptidase M20 dimerisation domain-containing protein n=1 Tax=Capsaspora owczarzaki (strain ATCC 30864) TaxID=595528 RepID=A0A0D2WTU3_CAPO3|nr:hypothetical protein CAOG_005616 [Capsaspora owczarzaki ATCC 30864]